MLSVDKVGPMTTKLDVRPKWSDHEKKNFFAASLSENLLLTEIANIKKAYLQWCLQSSDMHTVFNWAFSLELYNCVEE